MDNITSILGLCRGISWIAPEAKIYRKKCRDLAGRVKDLEELVEAIRVKGQVPQDVIRALRKLSITLTAGHDLVKKCAKNLVLNPLKCIGEFNSVNDDLRDTYHVLAGAVQVKHGNRSHRMLPQYVSDDDSDDDAPVVYGARPQNRYAAAAAASKSQQGAAFYAAEIGVEDDVAYFSETLFVVQ